MKKIENNLEKWLSETSKEGCGDDITVGIICPAGSRRQVED